MVQNHNISEIRTNLAHVESNSLGYKHFSRMASWDCMVNRVNLNGPTEDVVVIPPRKCQKSTVIKRCIHSCGNCHHNSILKDEGLILSHSKVRRISAISHRSN